MSRNQRDGPDPEAIGRICMHAILGTTEAKKIDLYRLMELIREHIVLGSYGRSVDFSPVLRELLNMDGVTEEGLFIGIINMIECLHWVGVTMPMPEMSLDRAEQERIFDLAEAATHSALSSFELRRLRAAINRKDRVQIGEMLITGHHITREQLDQALKAQKRHGRRLGTNLVEMGFISATALARFLGQQLDLPCITKISHVEPEVLSILPRETILQLRVFPLGVNEDGHLELGMEDPLDRTAIRTVERTSGRVVRPFVVPETTLTYAIGKYLDYSPPTRVRK